MKVFRIFKLVPAALFFAVAGLSQTVNVHDVDNGAFSPLKFSGNFTLNPGNLAEGVNFSVPQGKRYVIEFLNIRCSPQGNNNGTLQPIAEFNIDTYDVNNPLALPAPSITFVPTHAALGYFNYANNVKLYADHSGYSNRPSISVNANVDSVISANQSYYCTVFLSGYTVNLPAVGGQ